MTEKVSLAPFFQFRENNRKSPGKTKSGTVFQISTPPHSLIYLAKTYISCGILHLCVYMRWGLVRKFDHYSAVLEKVEPVSQSREIWQVSISLTPILTT